MINPKLYTSVEIAKRAREEAATASRSSVQISSVKRRYTEDNDY